VVIDDRIPHSVYLWRSQMTTPLTRSVIEHLIFDMDGTLIDSMGTHAAAFAEITSRSSGINQDTLRDLYIRTAGMPLDEQFRLALQESGVCQTDAIGAMIEQFWDLVSCEQPVVYPHVCEVLEKLHSDGFIMFISSGCAESVIKEKMSRVNLARYFLLMLGTDYVSVTARSGKGPEHFKVIRQKLGVTPEEFRESTAMAGDSRYDMEIARSAGVHAIGVSIGGGATDLRSAGAEAVCNDWRDFLGIVSTPSRSIEF
jgi:phosphoglycolate phosphatase